MFWKLEESRLVQLRTTDSAANALLVTLPGSVPLGKIWIITAFGYIPSVAETQVVSFEKYNNATAQNYGLLNPVSMNLNPAYATFIEQGMEYVLFPTETIIVRRVAATAGSTMGIRAQLIEIDQPLYTYEEPQEVKRQKFALSSIRRQLGGGVGRPGSMVGSAGRGGSGGGGRGGAEPV